MFLRPVRLILTLVGVALIVFFLWPQLFGLSRTNPFAFFVVSHGASAAVALIAMVAVLIIGMLAKGSKRIRRITRSLALWFLVFAIASAGLVVQRGWKTTTSEAKATHITVFSWNTMGAKATPAVIAKLALSAHANVVALPETNYGAGRTVAKLMAAAGSPMTMLHTQFDPVYFAHSTVLLISTSLGDYRLNQKIGSTSSSPSLVAVAPGKPTIIAAHAIAPDAAALGSWRKDLTWLAARCSEPNVIMAGDFNASIDNVSGLGPAPMGNCGDVALKLGGASTGTWPSSLPTLLGTQIDHVFYSAEWVPTAFSVITSQSSSASDHRPITATLIPVTK